MIQKYLDLSTGHVSAATAEWLDMNARKLISYKIQLKGEYGWLIFALSEEFDVEVPEDLLKVINYAKAKKCTWIMFDRDGATIDKLPYFEW